MIKIYVSKTTWSTTSIFGSVSSFLTGHWPHLLMFLNVLDGFFHKFDPGLGLSPALKDVENRLNVHRGKLRKGLSHLSTQTLQIFQKDKTSQALTDYCITRKCGRSPKGRNPAGLCRFHVSKQTHTYNLTNLYRNVKKGL